MNQVLTEAPTASTLRMSALTPAIRLFLFRTGLLLFAGVLLWFLAVVKAASIERVAADPILIAYALFVTTFELSRLVNAMFFKRSLRSVYEKLAPLTRGDVYEPYVSFVIPAMNEEAAIAHTIEQCFAADYPRKKIEVIVINDGSTDNTLDEILRMKEKYPALVVVDWKENRGKRHGMAEGFRLAHHEIIIQLDSDSYIEPTALRAFVAPFRNPEIGAVCAHADPQNADKNIWTKMQTAYYFMSFRILKAAESTYQTVFCCSGCSSAYRRSIVLPVLDTWLNESFLGLPVTWGDDRGLTNWVLRQGYRTIYTDEAQAYTIVPETLKQFVKQQIRWKKGWFVNSYFASKWVIRRDPFVAFTYFFPLTLVTLLTPFMAARALVYTPVVHTTLPSMYYFAGVFLIAGLIVVFYRFVAPNNKYWPYLLVWAAINMLVLSFLLFYALATIQNRGWGTRSATPQRSRLAEVPALT